MTSLIQSVDDRTLLAGTNRMEVLLFSLGKDIETGREELFGINVFKVREVMNLPDITHAPYMPRAIEGMVSLRGNIVPVINLPEFCGVQCNEKPEILMVTEFNGQVQGFMVDSVDTIERLDWNEVKAPPDAGESAWGLGYRGSRAWGQTFIDDHGCGESTGGNDGILSG